MNDYDLALYYKIGFSEMLFSNFEIAFAFLKFFWRYYIKKIERLTSELIMKDSKHVLLQYLRNAGPFLRLNKDDREIYWKAY